MQRDRDETLERMKILLSSPDGEILMEELKLTWADQGFWQRDPHEVQYMAGQLDCYRFMEMLRDGALIEETPDE